MAAVATLMTVMMVRTRLKDSNVDVKLLNRRLWLSMVVLLTLSLTQIIHFFLLLQFAKFFLFSVSAPLRQSQQSDGFFLLLLVGCSFFSRYSLFTIATSVALTEYCAIYLSIFNHLRHTNDSSKMRTLPERNSAKIH